MPVCLLPILLYLPPRYSLPPHPLLLASSPARFPNVCCLSSRSADSIIFSTSLRVDWVHQRKGCSINCLFFFILHHQAGLKIHSTSYIQALDFATFSNLNLFISFSPDSVSLDCLTPLLFVQDDGTLEVYPPPYLSGWVGRRQPWRWPVLMRDDLPLQHF